MFSRVRSYGLLRLRQLRYALCAPKMSRKSIHMDVPYFSQWESPGLNAEILSGDIRARDDPNWRRSGAVSADEYEVWSFSMCGMACTKMLLSHFGHGTQPVVALGKTCAEYSGYEMPLDQHKGLLYIPFLRFLVMEFDVHARVLAPMVLEDIVVTIGKGNYVIASVSPGIRQPKSSPVQKGGHLILILGYDLDEKVLYFHNPSGTSKQSQAYARISFHDFDKFFAYRGILVDNPRRKRTGMIPEVSRSASQNYKTRAHDN